MKKFLLLFQFCVLYVAAKTNEFGYSVVPDGSSAYSGAPASADYTAEVSQTGSSTFVLPIDAPRGLPGLEPKVSVSYDSHSGNGIAGYGCTISGLSVISVVPKDTYHDSSASGRTWTPMDALSLDGSRLVLKAGNYGSDGSLYCTETDPFLRITMHRSAVGSFTSVWFEARDNDGLTYTYGSTDDSRQDFTAGDGTRCTNAWYLSRVENALGSYMTYSYMQDSLTVYPSVISYGMNKADATHVNRLHFTYSNRTFDCTPFVINGARGALCKMLLQVQSETDGNPYRLYSFNYTTDVSDAVVKHQRLASIQISGCSKPVELSWNKLPADRNVAATLNLALPSEHHILKFLSSPFFQALDFNGDGISDIVEHIKVSQGTNPYNYFYFYRSQPGSQGVSYGNPVLWELPGDYQVDWSAVGTLSPMVSDYDGDGLQDLIVPCVRQSGDPLFYYYILYGSHITNGEKDSIRAVLYGLPKRVAIPVYTCSDVNGDGISDIIVLETTQNGNFYKCTVFEGNCNHGALNYTSYLLSLSSAPRQLYSSDYDGDGMSDLMAISDSGYKIFWNRQGRDAKAFSDSYSYVGTTFKNEYRVLEGDFDGDGLTDIVTNPNGDMSWYEYRNQGNGEFVYSHLYMFPVYQTAKHDKDMFNCRTIVADFNDDGKSDLLVSKAMYNVKKQFLKTYTCWLMSNRFGHIKKYQSTSIREADAQPGNFTVGDFHGNGRTELFNYGYDCLQGVDADTSPSVHVYPVAGRPASAGKLASVTDALLRTTSFSYESLANPDVYQKGTCSYPAVSTTVPLPVVSAMTVDQGAAGQSTTNYQYSDLRIHMAGRGVIGFSIITSSDNLRDLVTERGYTALDDILYVPTASYVKTISGGKITLTRKSTTYAVSGHSYSPQRIVQTSTDCDGLNTRTETVYDTFTHGRLMSKTVTCEQHNKAVTYQYQTVGSITRPSVVTYSQKHPDDASNYSYTDTYAFDDKGMLTTYTHYSDKSRPQTTNYSYDAFGNVLSKSVSSVSGEALPTEHYEYDATHRFLTHRYTSSQLPSYRYTYDNKGKLKTETTTRGGTLMTTTYSYNDSGLPALIQHPDGTKTTYSYGWGNTSSKRYFVLMQGTGKPWTKTWYDSCGREVFVETVGPKDVSVQTTSRYDARGQLVRQITDAGDRHQGRTLSYDGQGRLLSDALDSGHTMAYSYGKLRTATVEDGRTSVRTYDAWGNLKTVQQGTATVTYRYNSQGLPVSVSSTADKTANMSMQYDDMGCRTSLTDTDAGIITYGYDGLNRIVSQTDARGKTITTVYNNLGQKSSESCGSTVVYSYNTTGCAVGLLKKIKKGSQTLSYTYDDQGRVSTETHSYSSQDYTYTFDYNAQGRLSQKTYPGGVTESLEYDAYGNMIRQKIGTQTVWEYCSSTGKDETYSLAGGSLIRSLVHDNAGRLTSVRTSATDGSPYFQMSFDYENDGNMKERYLDGEAPERFSYDSYDRLTSATSSGRTQTFAYAPNGNILSKTGIGQYYYDEPQQHAVSEVDNTDGLISLAQQNFHFNTDGSLRQVMEGGQRVYFPSTGPDGQRWVSMVSGRTIYYLGDVEYVRTSPATWFYYMDNDVLYVRKEGRQDSIYYLCRDNQGSIMRIVDADGRRVFDATYDAWGYQTVNRNDIGFFRGYTGHEMLPGMGLIHMNGRFYDPLLGRFLSPDNYVQLPDNPQNLNRYSYCLNNPLKYTDPSGELFVADDLLLLVGGAALIGGIVNVASNSESIHGFDDFLGYFSIGAIAGSTGAALSTVSFGTGGFIAGAFSGLASGASYGFLLGGGNSVLQNGNFSHFWKDASMASISCAITGVVVGGLIGGVTASNEGRRIWTGEFKGLRNTQITKDNGSPTIFTPDHNAPSISGYNLSSSSTDDLYHRFPTMFDSHIVSHGESLGINGNSSMFYLEGSVNGVEGFYTIGINNETNMIYHRCFYNYDSFIRSFRFPK